MTLRELSASFKKYRPEPGCGGIYEPRESLADADGIKFLCPKCFVTPGAYVHPIYIGFAGLATPGTYGYNKDGQPVLWNMSGTSLDDLVLTPSIQIQGGCNWHGFVGSSGIPPGHAG